MGSCSWHVKSHWGHGRVHQHEVPSVGIPLSQCVEVMTENACREYCCPPCQSHVCCFCHCRTCPCAWRRKCSVLQCNSCLAAPWLRGSIFHDEMASCCLWSQVPGVMRPQSSCCWSCMMPPLYRRSLAHSPGCGETCVCLPWGLWAEVSLPYKWGCRSLFS